MTSADVGRKGRDRLVGLSLFVPTAIVIGLSAWLQPDPAGVGTHEQLGLAGCYVLDQFGFPCPMCGMTTTFSHMAHLELPSALLTQPFGVVLFLITLGAAVVGAMDLVNPAQRWLRAIRWAVARDRALAGGLLLAMIGGWLYKIALMREMLPWSP